METDDLFPDFAARPGSVLEKNANASLAQARQAAEHRHILQVLEANDWKIQPTADALEISRTTLWERMTRFGIVVDD